MLIYMAGVLAQMMGEVAAEALKMIKPIKITY